jgi:hypothetical protein
VATAAPDFAPILPNGTDVPWTALNPGYDPEREPRQGHFCE